MSPSDSKAAFPFVVWSLLFSVTFRLAHFRREKKECVTHHSPAEESTALSWSLGGTQVASWRNSHNNGDI